MTYLHISWVDKPLGLLLAKRNTLTVTVTAAAAAVVSIYVVAVFVVVIIGDGVVLIRICGFLVSDIVDVDWNIFADIVIGAVTVRIRVIVTTTLPDTAVVAVITISIRTSSFTTSVITCTVVILSCTPHIIYRNCEWSTRIRYGYLKRCMSSLYARCESVHV